jgi:hypothetical protein
MHAAPPVRMRLAPDAAWRVFAASTVGIAAASLIAWAALWAQVPAGVTATAAGLVAGTAAGVTWAVLRRHRNAVGLLAWDGAVWQWTPEAAEPDPGEIALMIDLGGWLLLRFTPTRPRAPAIWLTASRRQSAALWPAWRAALYARRPHGDLSVLTQPT